MPNAEKTWDRLAGRYDRTERRLAALHAQSFEIFRSHLKADDVALDFGCATGTKTLEAAACVKRVVGLDISSEMIALAKSRAEARRVENVEFVHSTLADSRFAPGTFDVVLSTGVLHLLEDEHPVLCRIAELLKPGGLFLSSTPCLGDRMTLGNRILFTLARVGNLTGGFGTLKRFRFPEVAQLIRRAGFQVAQNERLFGGLTSSVVIARRG